jgi:hypothetical protein
MGQLALHAAHPEIDTGLAKVARLELGVAIRHVQERHVAERRDVVKALLRSRGIGIGKPAETHAGSGCSADDLKKIALRQIHDSVIRKIVLRTQPVTLARRAGTRADTAPQTGGCAPVID